MTTIVSLWWLWLIICVAGFTTGIALQLRNMKRLQQFEFDANSFFPVIMSMMVGSAGFILTMLAIIVMVIDHAKGP